MSEEFDHSNEPTFTSFVPLLVLFIGLLAYFGLQDYSLNNQRALLNSQFEAAKPAITEAENISTRYVKLMKDLVETAQKNDNAKAIVNDAIKVGLIQVKPNANGTTPPTTPAPASK